MTLINSNVRLSGLGGTVRAPAVAGTFYPGARPALEATLGHLLREAPVAAAPSGLPKALIAPHAGYVYSGPVAATAYGLLGAGAARLRRVVLLGPAHRVPLRGMALPSVARFRTPLGDVALDGPALDTLRRLPQVCIDDDAHALEHSLEVHLPFLQSVLPEFTLVPVVVGHASPAAVAEVLEQVWAGPETLIVISTDLSHYHDYATAQDIDRSTCADIEAFRFENIGPEQACGSMPMAGLLLQARRRGLRIHRLDARNSGDTAGPRDRVVGYASFALYEPAPATITEADAAQTLPAIARDSILHGLQHGRPLLPVLPRFPARLRAPAAAFVTLMRRQTLRGCIGTTEPVAPLAHAVADSAFKAAFRDPRFPPLAAAEFSELTVSVSVLGPKEPVLFASEAELLARLRPGVDGLVIARGHRSATFLPSVWETLPQPQDFLAQLKSKAGLRSDESPALAWRYTTLHVRG
jgi:hypothetical protein